MYVPPNPIGSLERLFPGDSELAARMREFDWSNSPLGPTATWPQNLRTALGICLTSRFPMHLWWGPELILFYNDAYISFLGRGKHPAALGRSGREVWSEIWPTIGPMIERVRATGEASWSEDILMFFDRAIPKEEVYVTFSFSPVFGEGMKVDGLFCACTETSEKLIGNRRLETLRRLGIRAAEAQTVAEACHAAAEVLSRDPRGIPFAAVYVAEPADTQGRLIASCGLTHAHPLPHTFALAGALAGPRSPWPLLSVLRDERPVDVDLSALGLKLPAAPWPEPVRTAIVLPIPGATHGHAVGVLVVGVSPRRVLDAQYRSFFDLIAGHVGTAIAEARAHEGERTRAESLAALDRAKTTFFTNVSHELRTPLTLILAPLEEALHSVGEPSQKAMAPLLEMVHRNALRLLKLVNALLDFSRTDAGRIQANFASVDLTALTADLASVFRSAIERAGLKLIVDCEPLPQPVWVDRDMWEKIVLNLISNAFKFTFDGQIEVSLRPAGKQVMLTVRDSGVGVPAEELPRLFERFHRVEGVRARTHEGFGIGLALVQELVHLHGGEVRVESEVGRGTTFVVTVPFGEAHVPKERASAVQAPEATATAAAAFVAEALRWLPGGEGGFSTPGAVNLAQAEPNVELSQARILIADDNVEMREYLIRLLAQRWTVHAVADGEEALAALRHSPFELVVTDIMMPRLDGFRLLAALRADPALRAIPVLMLSARAGEESLIEALKAGADDYLIKPFSAREVIARVEAHLKLATRRQAIETNRAKDEFIAMLGHELRNPLSPIMTALEMMKLRSDGQFDKERAIIERQAQHLIRLVDDLLDISRITQGKVKLSKRPVPMQQVVAKAAEMAMSLIEQRQHKLDVHFEGAGIVADGDEERLAQVIANLLTNAAKYTDPGGHISVRARRKRAEVIVEVRDDGVGIAPDLLPHVFELFTQSRQAADHGGGGLGIGLAIVRSIVQLHGGSVEAASDGPGKGSVFTVRLPAASEDLASLAITPSATPRVASVASRILVVDDNEDALNLLSARLRAAHHVVKSAKDAPSAMNALKHFKADIAIIDIGLPVIDGYELAARLRAKLGNACPALIALTGYGRQVDRSRSEETGFAAHLTKPVDAGRLLEIIDETAAKARRPRANAALRPLRVVLVEDNVAFREAAKDGLEALGCEVHAVDDGPAGVSCILSSRPDIALLDIGLPKIDGYEVSRQVRASLGKSITLVALTGFGSPADAERSLSAGFDAQLTKPVTMRMLEEAVAMALGRRSAASAAGRKAKREVGRRKRSNLRTN
jgi:signal transduction histidine kinase